MIRLILSALMVVPIALGMLPCCGQKSNNQVEMKQKNNVVEFIDNYSAFKMDIEAAGIANIPEASLSENGELYIAYTYQSGNENRQGKMTLQAKMNNRFEGHWKTEADNGNVYQGVLYFVFKEDGQAEGFYQFGGSDYKITVFTP